MTTAPARPAAFRLTAYGVPKPQGSKRAFKAGPRIIITDASASTAQWRDIVSRAAVDQLAGHVIPLYDGPVTLSAIFTMPLPKRLEPAVRRGDPVHPDRTPDLDKLLRSLCDAVQAAGVVTDDARVVGVQVRKLYAGTPGAMTVPGVEVEIVPVTS